MRYTCSIADACVLTGVPASTIRRWRAEGRLSKLDKRKPHLVDLGEVEHLRDTLKSKA